MRLINLYPNPRLNIFPCPQTQWRSKLLKSRLHTCEEPIWSSIQSFAIPTPKYISPSLTSSAYTGLEEHVIRNCHNVLESSTTSNRWLVVLSFCRWKGFDTVNRGVRAILHEGYGCIDSHGVLVWADLVYF